MIRSCAWLRLPVLLASILITGSDAFGAGQPHEPSDFRAPVDSLDRHFHRVALIPTENLDPTAPRKWDDRLYWEHPVRNEQWGSTCHPLGSLPLEELIAERWRQAGFEVVMPRAAGADWSRLVAALGGLFDRRTGRIITERREDIWGQFRETLRDSAQVDLFVLYQLHLVSAVRHDGLASWEDQKHWKVSRQSSLDKAIHGFDSDEIGAVAIEARVQDESGRLIYSARTGVRPLVDADGQGMTFRQALEDTTANSAAVNRLWADWFRAVRPSR